jgi:hypothetical protein
MDRFFFFFVCVVLVFRSVLKKNSPCLALLESFFVIKNNWDCVFLQYMAQPNPPTRPQSARAGSGRRPHSTGASRDARIRARTKENAPFACVWLAYPQYPLLCSRILVKKFLSDSSNSTPNET